MKKKVYMPAQRMLLVTKSPFRQKIIVKRYGDDIQYIVKLFVIGTSSTGKTAFVKHWVKGSCPTPEKIALTVGVDFSLKHIYLDTHKALTIQIWDFGGAPRFKSIISLFLGGASFGLVFFDVTAKKTLEDVKEEWIPLISRYYDVDLTREGKDFLAIVGNKSDLIDFMPEETHVKNSELENFKKKYPLSQFVISAKTGHNMDLLTNFVVENIKKILPHFSHAPY